METQRNYYSSSILLDLIARGNIEDSTRLKRVVTWLTGLALHLAGGHVPDQSALLEQTEQDEKSGGSSQFPNSMQYSRSKAWLENDGTCKNMFIHVLYFY